MRVIFKTKDGYYQRTGKYTYNICSDKRDATVSRYVQEQIDIEAILKKHKEKYSIECIGRIGLYSRFTTEDNNIGYTSNYSYQDIVNKLGMLEDMIDHRELLSREEIIKDGSTLVNKTLDRFIYSVRNVIDNRKEK